MFVVTHVTYHCSPFAKALDIVKQDLKSLRVTSMHLSPYTIQDDTIKGTHPIMNKSLWIRHKYPIVWGS